jgi:hypothetical protein
MTTYEIIAAENNNQRRRELPDDKQQTLSCESRQAAVVVGQQASGDAPFLLEATPCLDRSCAAVSSSSAAEPPRWYLWRSSEAERSLSFILVIKLVSYRICSCAGKFVITQNTKKSIQHPHFIGRLKQERTPKPNPPKPA